MVPRNNGFNRENKRTSNSLIDYAVKDIPIIRPHLEK
jgi:hypothetical protein